MAYIFQPFALDIGSSICVASAFLMFASISSHVNVGSTFMLFESCVGVGNLRTNAI